MANVKDLLVNGSARVIGTIYGNATSADKVNHSLTFGSKSFNGSSAQTITLADLGGKPTQSAVSSPSASGTEISFIDTISQNANGVITATKKTVRDASASQSGVVSTGAQTFSGVKTLNNTLNLASINNVAFNFRPDSGSYYTTISYQTTGNEALVFATKNPVTSFMFVNGEDSITNHNSDRWRTLTPTLQMKNKSVYINSLIGDGVTPGYNFYVNGITYLNGDTTGSSTITANGALSGNANTKTPFSTTTDLYYVNKKLTWNMTSYVQHVILLFPVLTTTNWFGYNYIDGKFLCWKQGGNVYDTVEISANCVYNCLRYHLEYFGDHSNWALCICKYNNIYYYALNCPYHANPYTNVEFVGHIRSDLTGGTGTVSLPLDVPYYNENTATVLNEEVKNSITSTLTTTIVTLVRGAPLYSKDGFSGNLSGNADTATKLATARTISLTGSVTGSGTFDGSGNLSIATTTNHNHDSTYVNITGDTMTGKLQVNAPIFGYNYSKTNNAAAFIFDKPGSYQTGIGPNGTADTIYFCACDTNGSWSSYKQKWKFNGTATADTFYGSLDGNASSASKVNNKLTVGSKNYDGSAAVTISASDLGLASAMLFLGTTTTAITDGATTNPVAIGGSNKTVTAGNVVLYGSKEFVWTGSAWEELGNEGSYKVVQAAVADPSASGTSNTFIATISQDTNGKITATKKTVAVTNSAPTLEWGTTSTIGTVAGTNLQVTMPANPNTWRGIQNNLTSDSTTDSLAAAQGKVLKALIDSKAASSHTHSYLPLSGGALTGNLTIPSLNTAFLFNNTDIPEGASNLMATTSAHKINFYRNGITIPYQMDNADDGGIIRCRGTSESNTIFEIGTWDDSGAGETIQFNYYPTTSQVTPTYSVTVPKRSGTIALAGDAQPANGGNSDTLDGYHFSDLEARYLVKSGDTITGNILIAPGEAGGVINGSATNGGLNSILIGDDVWLGDCNVGGTLGLKSNNTASAGFSFYGIDGTNYGRIYYDSSGGHSTSAFYGAVWNDYAEYRQSDTTQPGRCIIENGDDTLSLSTSRLQKGAEIVSDTFGFAIGETDDCKTPIACSGRVLAYPYESREEFKKHIGDCVCSGPNGTVSIMTPEEEKEYPSCIIGTISAVPSYEKWGSGEVDVSGRVWIRIR